MNEEFAYNKLVTRADRNRMCEAKEASQLNYYYLQKCITPYKRGSFSMRMKRKKKTNKKYQTILHYSKIYFIFSTSGEAVNRIPYRVYYEYTYLVI